MRHAFLMLACIAIMICSCKKDKINTVKQEQDDPNWIKLEIPNARDAYAFAGSIDDTLLVTTWVKAYFTTNKGKTWQESKNFNGQVQGLITSGDSVIALAATGGLELEGTYGAGLAQYYTLDYGRSWNPYLKPDGGYRSKSIGISQSADKQVTYKLKYNVSPLTKNDYTAYIHNPTQITRTIYGSTNLINFPFKRKIHNLYLDNHDRLYVAASGGAYIAETNSFNGGGTDDSAIIYISRNTLP
ncbi:hypothetical protein ABDD95_02810 [Mucilaginibacter sp. PAMB04274]|uniref:hypothetical protein n=1 Tax=Mucilaginibacter sp. PAMB04274 TaxID=3138568 RepID=UPI0031F66E7F